jgi:hypothetical protein
LCKQFCNIIFVQIISRKLENDNWTKNLIPIMNFIISNSYKMFVFVECNIVYNIFQHIMDTEDCVTVSGLNMSSAFVVQTMFFEKKLVLKTFLRKRKRQQSFFFFRRNRQSFERIYYQWSR